MTTKNILVIPDSHANPRFNNKRYFYLGKLISDLKPDIIVDIGDWFDMESLSSYDKGKRSFEGRRYKKDIDAGLEAQDFLNRGFRHLSKKPKKFRTLGNHEVRISRATQDSPELDGILSLNDLQSKEYGFEEFPFLEPLILNGVTFQHYFTSGLMGRPIGGENHAKSLINKQLTSCVQGHSHLFDYAVRTNAHGKKIIGCVVGVYQDYWADYAGPANKMWYPGVVYLKNVDNGQFDIEHISLKTIKNKYGEG